MWPRGSNVIGNHVSNRKFFMESHRFAYSLRPNGTALVKTLLNRSLFERVKDSDNSIRISYRATVNLHRETSSARDVTARLWPNQYIFLPVLGDIP